MILDIQSLAAQYIADITRAVEKLHTLPKLVVIMVGDNPASAVYVRNKIRKCAEVGMQ
jgi:methylenetetrahydrofolate dehydrogenase (NADP+)/methenyltetrahydrofolate cyclohydrolase